MAHEFGSGGICAKCGHSRTAAEALGLECQVALPGISGPEVPWKDGGPYNLLCDKCGARYGVGEDAVIITTESASEIMRGRGFTVLIDEPNTKQDLVASSSGLPFAMVEQAKSTAKLILQNIRDGATREWICKACDNVNSYPINRERSRT